MIKAYAVDENNRIQQVENRKEDHVKWIHITQSNEKELKMIADEYHFPIDYLSSAFDSDEVARYENVENLDESAWRLIILLFPIKVIGKSGLVEYVTRPLSIIASKGILITASLSTPHYIQDIIDNFLDHPVDIQDHVQFTLHVAMNIADRYIYCLKEINHATELLEINISRSSDSNQLLKMMELQKSLVYFDTAINTNHPVISKLQETEYFISNEKSKELLRDVRVQNMQAENMIRQTLKLLGQISDTFSSVISNNLNNTMKFLTSVTIVMTIPSLVGALWGMNVPVPWQKNGAGFLITMTIIILLSILTTYWLKKKDYF